MKYLSVCSGIEAATVAWHGMGWKPLAFSEIEKFPAAVLAHHYPETPNLGDMTKFKEWENYAPDILVGGTPCQSFSVAGLRKGLDDPRGNLMLTYIAIADRYRPRWIVWENVPGVLSSNGGKDFGTFLGALGEIGYGFAYRVLDAQYFGVPQRRRRVFVVGHLGDWRRAAAVLFEQHSLSGHPAPSRKKGEEVAGTIGSRTKSGGGFSTDFECAGGLQPVCGQSGTKNTIAYSIMPMNSGKDYKARETNIAQPLMAGGPVGGNQGGDFICAPISPTVTNGPPFSRTGNERVECEALVCMAHGQANAEISSERSPALTCNHEAPIVCHGTQNPCIPDIASAQGRNNGGENVLCLPINTQIATRHNAMGEGTGFGIGKEGDPSYTLQSAHSHAISTGAQVRRLTPTECERLQGFPDGYTNIPWRNKPESPDGPRYKALGNSMAVPVMRWIGERINLVDLI